MEKTSKRGVPPPNGILNFPDIEKKTHRFDIVWSPKMGQIPQKSPYIWQKQNFSQRKRQLSLAKTWVFTKVLQAGWGCERPPQMFEIMGSPEWLGCLGTDGKKNWLNRSSQIVLLRILRDLGLGTEFLLCFWGFLPWKKLHLSFLWRKNLAKWAVGVRIFPQV